MSFNEAQLTTLTEATALANKLTQAGVGGGVTEIYKSTWMPGPGSFEMPQSGKVDADGNPERQEWYFRFANGKDGVNAGLVRDTFKRYNDGPYALTELKNDIGAGDPPANAQEPSQGNGSPIGEFYKRNPGTDNAPVDFYQDKSEPGRFNSGDTYDGPGPGVGPYRFDTGQYESEGQKKTWSLWEDVGSKR